LTSLHATAVARVAIGQRVLERREMETEFLSLLRSTHEIIEVKHCKFISFVP
jgi:hypothetical protein